MSKKIQLQIAEPCHENWDSMTPVEQGKFCGSCQKQVVDFTGMSDRQVAAFFKKPSTGSVCGRFMNDQLERDIEIPRKRIPWVKYFFTIALPAFFLSKASAQKMGKPQVTPAKDTVVRPVETERIMLGMVAPDRIVPQETDRVPVSNANALPVWVVDAITGKPVIGADIIMNTSIGKEKLQSDAAGKVLLNIFRKLSFHGIEISSPGYNTKTISYGEFKKGADGRIVFTLDKMVAVKDDVFTKGEVDSVPVCNIRMGAVAYPIDIRPVAETTIKGIVVDENNNPVPFATIAGGKKGEGVMADENGEFIISNKWLKKGKSLEVSSAGFENSVIRSGEESYRDGGLLVQLKARNTLEEVVISTGTVCTLRHYTVGSLTIIKGQTIVVNKEEDKKNTETNIVMDEPQLQVYPNPAAAGSTIHLGLKNPVEDYYQLQIVSAAGQLVKQQEIWLDAEARLLNIELPSVTAGTYFIILSNRKTGKKYSQKIVVQ